MQAELPHRLGYPKHDPKGNNGGNSRNGKSKKTLKGEFASLARRLWQRRIGLNKENACFSHPFPGGWKTLKLYLRVVPQPASAKKAGE